ncbi:class I SAM-dependent methyltransferase [Thermodesulfobacteriota bacterium]
MRQSNYEYIILRLVRKFIFPEKFLTRYGDWVPYYRTNQGQISPVPIVEMYAKYCQLKNIDPTGNTFLEIGSGATNCTGYEIIGRWGGSYIGYDPYAPFNHKADERIYNTQILNRFQHIDKKQVLRITNLNNLDKIEVDIIFSHSVLEHVFDLDKLLVQLKKVMKDNTCMFHLVDYRDHFFKYPFHFLKYSENVWNRLLNPGDLTRTRISGHINSFINAGFSPEIVYKKLDKSSFEKIKNYIHPVFKKYSDEDLATVYAVFFIQNSE